MVRLIWPTYQVINRKKNTHFIIFQLKTLSLDLIFSSFYSTASSEISEIEINLHDEVRIRADLCKNQLYQKQFLSHLNGTFSTGFSIFESSKSTSFNMRKRLPVDIKSCYFSFDSANGSISSIQSIYFRVPSCFIFVVLSKLLYNYF